MRARRRKRLFAKPSAATLPAPSYCGWARTPNLMVVLGDSILTGASVAAGATSGAGAVSVGAAAGGAVRSLAAGGGSTGAARTAAEPMQEPSTIAATMRARTFID